MFWKYFNSDQLYPPRLLILKSAHSLVGRTAVPHVAEGSGKPGVRSTRLGSLSGKMLLGCPCAAANENMAVYCGTVCNGPASVSQANSFSDNQLPPTPHGGVPPTLLWVCMGYRSLHSITPPLEPQAGRGVIATREKESKPGGTRGWVLKLWFGRSTYNFPSPGVGQDKADGQDRQQ